MKQKRHRNISSLRHRVIIAMALCLFGVVVIDSVAAPYQKRRRQRKTDERIYLEHSDELFADEIAHPGVQVVKGKVRFRHRGARLTCDSAYFHQADNTFEAFGHVRMTQGDTLSLKSEYAYYDGRDEMVRARRNVVLRHRKSVLYTDSLDFDRMYNLGYFFEGGRMDDGVNHLVSDWGEYDTQSHEAIFYFGVKLKNPDYTITTDTLHYNTRSREAHVKGPSVIVTEGNTITTDDGTYNTAQREMHLTSRSTVENGEKTIIGDTLLYNSLTGEGQGFGNVIYKDRLNKNELHADQCFYNEKQGTALATRKALVIDYSQPDTLWLHADTIRMETFHQETDSMYRKIYGYYHVRAFRRDVQAVCDSLVICTQDSSAVMYHSPIVWNDNRQLLGDTITAFAADSTLREAYVNGNALSIERMDDGDYFNQISSRDMEAHFIDGVLRTMKSTGNVMTIYYPIDDKDSSIIGMNYLETDTLRLYLNSERQMEKIHTTKYTATTYPLHQIPSGRDRLPSFAWYDNIRPRSKRDIFIWKNINQSTTTTQ